MNKRVWIFQQKKEVEKKGADAASWYVGWYDLRGSGTRKAVAPVPAVTTQRKSGFVVSRVNSTPEFISRTIANSGPSSRPSTRNAFFRAWPPRRKTPRPIHWAISRGVGRLTQVQSINTAMIDEFVSKRRLEAGQKPRSVVSPRPSTKTSDTSRRHYGWPRNRATPDFPKIRMVKEPQKLPTFVTPEHFDLIYTKACDFAKLPNNPGQHSRRHSGGRHWLSQPT